MKKKTGRVAEVLFDTSDAVAKAHVLLEPILSPRQPIQKIEKSFTALEHDSKALTFSVHWIEVISVSNIELAYSFASQVGKAYKQLGLKGLRVWVGKSLSVYDREGLYPAVRSLENVSDFKSDYIRKSYTCELREIKPRLSLFIQGLAGRKLLVKEGTAVYTDTETLYLPKSLSVYRQKEKNRALYKSMACFLWAQTWYGTFRRKSFSSLSANERLESYKQEDAKQIFLVLENIRLLANIKKDLPGLYREMELLSPIIQSKDRTLKVITQKLEQEGSSVEDSFEALDTILRLRLKLSSTTDYLGEMKIDQADLILEKRKTNLGNLINEITSLNDINMQDMASMLSSHNEDKPFQNSEEGDQKNFDRGNDKVLSREQLSKLKGLVDSLLQDVDSINISDIEDQTNISEKKQQAINPGQSEKESQYCLEEWDYLRQAYREQWCKIRLDKVLPGVEDFKYKTDQKYPFVIAKIQRLFEAMRDQPRVENRQTDGEDIDLDAVIDMYTARYTGEELSERMYLRRQHNERSVAVCVLVDMSGSTKGWINLAMRESLIIFSEALQTLGDQYAIMGFSGLTRQRCEIYEIKDFSEPRSPTINHRIANIQAKDYTRMGFAVRHASNALMRIESKHRILLLLSDGKPDDYDGYQGEYGIQDTRKAILEAQGKAISPFSITIDKQAQSYLPRLFGPGQYTILQDVSDLPYKLSEIYRKLSA